MKKQNVIHHRSNYANADLNLIFFILLREESMTQNYILYSVLP